MVILVDENDMPTGRSEKMEAHRDGVLHRAFSVFIFNRNGELLIQRRAQGKYHSPGLWANTCCSHPLPGEETLRAANKRLAYEMGMSADLTFREAFIYKANVGGGLTEHEYDHIFTGVSDMEPRPNPAEVMEYRYARPEDILRDMEENSELYSAWFRIIFSNYYHRLKKWAE